MTQEQKAKAYDEALERAKNCLKDGTITNTAKSYIETIFPELKESEDEKIKEWLITLVKDHIEWLEDRIRELLSNGQVYGGELVKAKNSLAWLEKQGEQKSTLPKWKYKKDHTPLLRDSLILNKYGCVAKSPSGALVSDVWVIDYAELAKLPKEVEKQGEKKPADKVEQKGMNIVEEDMTPFQKKVFCIIDTTIEEEQGLKQVCDELLRLAHDEIIQKPAWSEEDEVKINRIVACLENLNVADNDILLKDVDWLKSLKPQNRWKPSDEQMAELRKHSDNVILRNLYYSLKKLKS